LAQGPKKPFENALLAHFPSLRQPSPPPGHPISILRWVAGWG
jgi:hypothetical protein